MLDLTDSVEVASYIGPIVRSDVFAHTQVDNLLSGIAAPNFSGKLVNICAVTVS